MSVKVARDRLIVSSITKFGALYQHILRSVSSFQKIGDELIQEANTAQSFRQVNKIEEMGLILSNIPIREYQLIGQYYVGLVGSLRGEAPRKLLEEVVEHSKTYRAKALISIAVIEAREGNYTSELNCFTEALKYANSPSTKIEALRGIAIVKAKEGFNKQALKDLEAILPLARYGDMRVCHDYLNSYAVELIEVGRIEEASNISRIVLASPFAFAYPEWRETGNGVALRGYKSRSVVLVPELPLKVKDNVFPMPVVERSPDPPQQGSAKLFDLKKWAKKMVKKPNGDEKNEDLENMEEKDLMVKLMYLATDERLNEKKLRKLVKYALQVLSEPSEPED